MVQKYLEHTNPPFIRVRVRVEGNPLSTGSGQGDRARSFSAKLVDVTLDMLLARSVGKAESSLRTPKWAVSSGMKSSQPKIASGYSSVKAAIGHSRASDIASNSALIRFRSIGIDSPFIEIAITYQIYITHESRVSRDRSSLWAGRPLCLSHRLPSASHSLDSTSR
jgi:hypothetical protein